MGSVGDTRARTEVGFVAGGALATFAAVRSFGPSMHPRGRGLQAAVTAGSVALALGAGVASEQLAGAVGGAADLDPLAAHAATAGGAAVGAALLGRLAHRGGGLPPRLGLRAGAAALTVLAAGSVLTGAATLGLDALRPAARDTGIVGGTPAQVERQEQVKRAGSWTTAALMLGGAVAGGVLGARAIRGFRTPMPSVPALDDAASLVRRSQLDTAGLRFLDTIPTDLGKTPLRAFVGLRSARSVDARAALLVDEAVRQGALERAVIAVHSPSGGGHVNPTAAEAIERLFDGDVASIAAQYGNLPSAFSFHRVRAGRRMHEAVLRALKARVDQLPEGKRPLVVVYGESLGAWTSQDVLRGGPARLRELGVDRAIWAGVPGYSAWHPAKDGQGAAAVIDDVADLRALTDDELAARTMFSLTNPDDPVGRASHRLLVEHPEWLREPRPPGVSPEQRYTYGVTFLQSLADVIGSRGGTTAGDFTNVAHDYRLQLAELMRDALGLRGTVDDIRLAGVVDALRERERDVMAMRW